MLRWSYAFSLIARLGLCACPDILPFSLPVTDVQLSNGNTRRGIPATIGSPPQNFSFMPHAYLNDTWVYNTSAPFCINGSTETQCLTQRGGEYDPGSSSSSHGNLDVYGAGGDPSDTARALGTHIWYSDWATDTVNIGNASFDGYPIGMAGFDFGGRFDTQGNIGLGANSTLMNALADGGHIPSRTYSYWWGIDNPNPDVAMDGQIVFGGYDAAKVTGPNVTAKLLDWTAPCPSGMYLDVLDILLDFPNGTTASILSGAATLSACIQPDFPFLMTLANNPYYENFMNLTETVPENRTLGIYWYAPNYAPSSVYPGDLTIALNSGFDVKVSNDVMVVPDQYVGPSGAVQTNDSADVFLLGPLDGVNANNPPIIGMQFLSAAYMMVDLDARTFTLWQANPTTESRLVSVGGTCSEKPAVNSGSGNVTTSSNQTASTSGTADGNRTQASAVSTPSSTGRGISTGTIVGAVIGSAFGAALLAAALVFVILRRRRSRKSPNNSSVALTETERKPDEAQAPGWYYDQPTEPYEAMPGQLNELSGVQTEPQELGAQHMPLEKGDDGQRFAEMPGVQTPRQT